MSVATDKIKITKKGKTMFEKIDYFAPYFNDTLALRKAYEAKHPDYTFDMISAIMVGALSVYVPSEKFEKLISDTLDQASKN